MKSPLLILSKTFSSFSCPKPQGEIFDNRNFDCGLLFWETNSYGGNLIDNNDGTITLEATSEYSSLTQSNKFPIPAGRYHIGVVVTNVTGQGKYAYRTASGWNTAFTFDAPGTYEMDIDVTDEITAIDIGAHGDSTFICTFDGVACIDTAAMPMPDWYKIGSLDTNDILGVWDWTWIGHGSQSDTLVNLEGIMPNMSIDSGTPTWQGHENGMNFGGAGSIASRFPDNLDNRDITVLAEYHSAVQNGTLDALYSHYHNDSRGHYTLQNGWGSDAFRWSCGDENSETIEIPQTRDSGIVTTAGRNLYFNGSLLGTVTDSGPSSTSNNFTFGCIVTDSGRTQYSKLKLKKLLIVNRVLSETEIQEIVNNISNTSCNEITYNNENITYNGEIVCQ